MDKKTTKSEIITIRLDPLTKQKLEYIANLEYRPMALQIRKIIEEFIYDYEEKHPELLEARKHQKYPHNVNYSPDNLE